MEWAQPQSFAFTVHCLLYMMISHISSVTNSLRVPADIDVSESALSDTRIFPKQYN